MNRITKTLYSLCSLAFLSASSQAEEKEIRIIAVNDMHAQVEGFPAFMSFLEEQRSIDPELLLVSGGDNRSGNPLNDMYPRPCWPMISLMNKAGFIASAIGNHEFDAGLESLDQVTQDANFTFLCANMNKEKGQLSRIFPSMSLECKGLRVLIVGLTQKGENGYPDAHPRYFENLSFNDVITTSRLYGKLREQHDLFIYLTHEGFEADIELAQAAPWADLIVGGHSHTFVEKGHLENGVLITQSGNKLKAATVIELKFDDKKLVDKKSELIYLNDYAPHAETQKIVDEFSANSPLKEVIGENETNITARDELGSMMADAMRSAIGAEIAIVNYGGVRMEELPAGPITMQIAYQLDPFDNEIVEFKLTGHEIRDFLIAITRSDDHGSPCVSGMQYSAKLSRDNILSEVVLQQEDGTPLPLDAEYKVVTSSFVASSVNFSKKSTGQVTQHRGAQSLIQFLKEKQKVNYTKVRRAHIEREVKAEKL